MRRNFFKVILSLFTLTLFSCNVGYYDFDDDGGGDDYFTSYRVANIRIVDANNRVGNISFNYDFTGRIVSVRDTYEGVNREFYYDDRQGVIEVKSSNGDTRFIELNHNGFAKSEEVYRNGIISDFFEYDYYSEGLVKTVMNDIFDNRGNRVAIEDYEFSYNRGNNLEEIYSYYEDSRYTDDFVIGFSNFTNLENNFNIDMLSIMGCFIDNDVSSRIGIVGNRSRNLPLNVTTISNFNTFDEELIEYDVRYITDRGYITRIDLSSPWTGTTTYYISYK